MLRKKSEIVHEITKKTLRFIKDMEKTMLKSKGVGLAAPQVGVHERIVLITLDDKKILPLINPKIITVSENTTISEEGCLSLPGEWGKVRRPIEATVQFLTTKGQKMVMKFCDFEAIELQHEIDHLDGILFVDYLDDDDINLDNVSGQKEVEKI